MVVSFAQQKEGPMVSPLAKAQLLLEKRGRLQEVIDVLVTVPPLLLARADEVIE